MADEDTTRSDPRQRRRTLLGMLIILGLVGAAMLVFFLDAIIGAFHRRYEIVALVPDAPGVAAGTPVWVGGKEVGSVVTVAILPSSADTLGRVAVTLLLPRHVQPQVRTDSRVRLTSASLMSEAAIDIVPGSAAAAALAEGDTLRTVPGLTREQLTQQAAAVREDLRAVLASVQELAPLIGERMEATRRAFAGLDAAMVEARQIQAGLRSNPGVELLRDPAFRQSLEQARGHAAELPATFARLQDRAGAAGEVRVAIARLQARADSLAAQLDAAAALLDQPAGTLGRLQHDDALGNAIDAARASLDSLVAEVRRNPLRFVF
jgi:phospholipid/cholesterol/gamma-HCH transport system substrate-binding protein